MEFGLHWASKRFFKDVKAENSANGAEKCKILGILKNQEMENLDDHGSSKTQDFVEWDEKCKCAPATQSYKNYTSQWREESEEVWWMDNAALEVVKFVLYSLLFMFT